MDEKLNHLSDSEIINTIHDNASRYRGVVIQASVFLELNISELIRHCLFKEYDQFDLFFEITGIQKLNSEKKIKLAKHFTKIFQPQCSHMNFSDELDFYNEKRNMAAHHIVDITQKGITEFRQTQSIIFIDIKNNQRVKVNLQDTINHVNRISKLEIELRRIIDNKPIKSI